MTPRELTFLWVWGCATPPVAHVAANDAARRLSWRCGAASSDCTWCTSDKWVPGCLLPQSAAYFNFSRLLLKIPEHTWW